MDIPATDQNDELEVVDISPGGDVLLDVAFETSRETLKEARKAAKPRPGQKDVVPLIFKANVRRGYRVKLSVLKERSRYFHNLLVDTRFAEAKSITEAFDRLSIQKIQPSDAPAHALPRIKIQEDDEATQTAGQETVFGDLLRVLHLKAAVTKPVTIRYLATLAVLADRFDCATAVSKNLNSTVAKIKWPTTQTQISREDGSGSLLTKAMEETLRQKILVSWLFDQPLKMHAATRELIMYGSRRWFIDEEKDAFSALWWNLPDGLEDELQHRRECILRTIASVQSHFLGIYSSRERQCQLGYDSSASCDSYQLGEMVKFLISHNLLFLVDFSPSSIHPPEPLSAYATVDINHILSVLRQCPAYQIDRNHTSCGLRRRILPILDFINAMLASTVVSITRTAWKKDRAAASWFREDEENKTFRFTRSLSGNLQLQFPDMIGPERLARSLFTADAWDWTPKE